VTVQFAPVDTTEARREHAVGTISSLRTKSDPLFFEALEFISQEMDLMWQRESRMDVEIIMLELSPALFSVVLILQLRHAKKHPEAVASMSITMLVVLALGYQIPLMLDFEPAIRALQDRFDPVWTWYRIVPNRFPLRVGTMLAFLLQLRLLQLALEGRRPTEPGRGGDGPSAATERRTLQACLLLHFLGAVLMLIVNRGDGRPRLLIDATDPTPADVLVSYGGLVLDGFLLPQVISNAFSGAKARALSPWFYVGGTVIRATPHAYDVYAGPRGNLFGGVALDVAVLLGVALLAVLLFLQQRVLLRGAFVCSSSSKRRSGAYRMVSSVPSG
jgi:ubiquitin-conjugating enzyme E2 O